MRALATRFTHGPQRWLLLAVPILAWALHLTFSASIVQFTCNAPEWRWTLYAVTPVTLVPTVLAGWIGAAIWRVHSNDAGHEEAQLHFLGFLVVASAAFNVVLILAEGVLVPFYSSCG